MDTIYDVISSTWSSHFCVKIHVFQLSTIKENLVAKIMQSAYLCVIFHVKLKQLPFLAVLPWFLLLGKIHDGGQDGDHCWWRHRPPAHLVKKIKGFPLKIKSFWNTITYQKLRGGVPSTPPSPLYHRGGGGGGVMTLLVLLRIKGTTIGILITLYIFSF